MPGSDEREPRQSLRQKIKQIREEWRQIEPAERRSILKIGGLLLISYSAFGLFGSQIILDWGSYPQLMTELGVFAVSLITAQITAENQADRL